MKKLLLSAVSWTICAGLVFGLSGCASSKQTTSESAGQSVAEGQSSEEIEKIGVALTIGTPHANPAVVAQEKGYFEEFGLEADLQTYSGGPAMMEALPSGSWDVCVVAIPGWIPGAVNHNLKIVGLGPWDQDGINLNVRPDSDIAQAGQGNVDGFPDIYGDAETWKGKNVLLPTGTTAHMTLLATLEALGLTEDDVKITNIDVGSGFTAFKAGQGDILGSWTLNSVYAQDEGYVVASSATAVNVDIPIIICASDEVMANNPGLVEKFLKAYGKGAQYQQENKEEAAEIMADFNNSNGFKTDVDSCYELIKNRSTDVYSDQLAFFEEGKMTDLVCQNLDFFISTGTYDESIWETLQACVTSEVLEKVA